MGKGILESTIAILMALIILIVMVSLFWTSIRASGESPEGASDIKIEAGECNTDEDCLDNPNGNICMQIGSFDSSLKTFCGCRININCERGSLCGEDNKCQ